MDTRIFVQKKEQFQVESESLGTELRQSLSLSDDFKVSLYNIYDIFNADENDIQLLKKNVLSTLRVKNILPMNIYQGNMIKELIALCSV